MTPVGIDFGTSNSAIAVMRGGEARLAHFGPEALRTFRSLLFFEEPFGGERPPPVGGPLAIERYLEAEGRLIQSIKSHLSSRKFQATSIFGRTYTIVDLLTILLRGLLDEAKADLGPLGGRAVVGRPVSYVGDGAEALALERMRKALKRVGFSEVDFMFEPVGAAYEYESKLERDEIVCVADFGGGTSDFSLLCVGPSLRGGDRSEALLGVEGVPLAGDAFDGRIVEHVVAPRLGKGSRYRSAHIEMPVPTWLYGHLEHWHLLSFLKARKSMDVLVDVTATALEPTKLRAFLELVREDLGFHLFRAVEACKVELSSAESTVLRFQSGTVQIEERITRADFESWIAPEIDAMGAAVDRLLEAADLEAGAVDRVFMTGGTAMVPAVRSVFDARFGADRVLLGDRFTSVAAGLARAGAEPR